MAKQNSTDILKEKIRLLEIRQAEEGKILKAQFDVTVENLKPVNLLKSAAKEFASSDELRVTLLESSVVLTTGFLSKKIMDSTKGGPFIKLLTSLLQLVAPALVSQYSEQIQNFIMGFVDRFLKKPAKEQPEE
jgi:hypothetical protein